jgi:hypothetical protein
MAKTKKTTVKVETKTEFVVVNKVGIEVRTYSVDLHGDKAGELAKEFAGSNNCIIK